MTELPAETVSAWKQDARPVPRQRRSESRSGPELDALSAPGQGSPAAIAPRAGTGKPLGLIEVTAAPFKGGIEIRVRDHGPGVPPEVHDAPTPEPNKGANASGGDRSRR
jgi:hypothetical protein